MSRFSKIVIAILMTFISLPIFPESRKIISLDGVWKLYLDADNRYSGQNIDIPFKDEIQLPGTLDEVRKGNKTNEKNATNHLQRKYSYYGKAWYKRDILIPENWRNRPVELTIERTRPTKIFVDGHYAGENLLITAPQNFDLTSFLSPGKHKLTIMVDNGNNCGIPSEIGSSNMWSDDTQTNWNGMIGKIELISKPSIYISSFRTQTDFESHAALIDLIVNNSTKENHSVVIRISTSKQEQKQLVELKEGENRIHFFYPLNKNVTEWSEYSPKLFNCKFEILKDGKTIDDAKTRFGFRKFSVQDKNFLINGHKTFLRGKHDACIFPQTGYAPMDEKNWIHYFRILKNYGFNHVRFHSWCPPEAAFTAADRLGLYLQPELPLWGMVENDPTHPLTKFLLSEGKAMLDSYGNHPSFVMFSSGNELWGDISSLQYLTSELRKYDHRPLYTLGTNHHLGWLGEQKGEDYMVTCRVGGKNDEQYEPHVRSSFSFADAVDGGILNASYPNSIMDFTKGTSQSSKPVVSHETGQFQMYPDDKDLKNYKGVLVPSNIETFILRIKSQKGAENYKRYFDATAALSLLCYKADMEMMRRTKDLAGFEMLDLQDFPGQGTAIVGMLNATMHPKGVISQIEFRNRNNDILPLWLSDSFTFIAGRMMKSSIKISNNSFHDLLNADVEWKIIDSRKRTLARGSLTMSVPSGKLSDAESLDVLLPNVEEAVNCKLTIKIKNTSYWNNYDLWIYPSFDKMPSFNDDIKLFTHYGKELNDYLISGGKALLMPDLESYPEETVGGLFTSDYWNFSMFRSISEKAGKPVSPGTLGLLIETNHPLFKNFPTENHSNWQWWAAVKNSNPLILDAVADKIHPIVETIDNAERLYFLGTMFECRVGQGLLFVCMSDLKNHLTYTENKQLYLSLIRYLNSTDFNPQDELTANELKQLFMEKKSEINLEGVKNISYK